MYRRRDNILFRDGALSAMLDNRAQSAKDKVDNIQQDQFLTTPIDDIVKDIADNLCINALELHEDNKKMRNEEIEIDISGNPNYNLFGEPGPIYVPGIKVTISIPYTGNYNLWKLTPDSYKNVLPRADVRFPGSAGNGCYLDIIIEQPASDPQEEIKSYLDRVLHDIRWYIAAQKKQIDGYNRSLEKRVRNLVEARRERLKKHANLADFLNIPGD